MFENDCLDYVVYVEMNVVLECMDVILVFYVYKYFLLIYVLFELSMIEIKILKLVRVYLVFEIINFIINVIILVKYIFKFVCIFN